MGSKATEEIISTVRSIVGDELSDMDIIRALHMAKNNPTAAINIIFDTPQSFRKPEIPQKPEPSNIIIAPSEKQNADRVEDSDSGSRRSESLNSSAGRNEVAGSDNADSKFVAGAMGSEWWLVGNGDVAGMSTCKGRVLRAGDEVNFTFPGEKNSTAPSPGKLKVGRARHVATCSEIVRFSTNTCGEIGRIPNEWARCLLPLVRDKKVCLKGYCKSAPPVLGIMDTVDLAIRIYINSSMFQKSHKTSLKASSNSAEESIVQPLPTLFKLLGLVPFKKAEFTPGDLYTRKRPLNAEDSSLLPPSILHISKVKSAPSGDGNNVENEESVSDNDLDNIVGVTDNSELEEMEPPSTLSCELRSYQKQALNWMVHLERGHCVDEAASTLHPCWDAYRLEDRRGLVIYVNSFSGEATTEFPSTLQMARGGILADSMGLGKTIMTISLLLTHSGRGGSLSRSSTSQLANDHFEAGFTSDKSPMPPKKASKLAGFEKLMKKKASLVGGGNLIICPMTLVGQWKTEIETHAQPGALSVYVHYGQSRSKDPKVLAHSDVVLTTYGVLASEFSTENAEDNGGLFSVRWFRVVLDEAHTIKSSKSQVSVAAAALSADCRWCLTGTPIQNNVEDVFSLLRFLKIEPWGSWAWWNKLVQKPFEEGDGRGLKLVQSILKPIMLRRTKSSTDREGRPILVLPPADVQVIYCNLTEVENDFYEALFKKSKVKFDQFVEQGRVLHNYASILELLLRLRQCCDHPFLVLSRGDAQEYSDLNKLARRFLKGGSNNADGQNSEAPSRAYIQEVVDELRKGEQGECPICLEAFEDAVLTPCAHRLCRECLLASWRGSTSGLCPVCRAIIVKAQAQPMLHRTVERKTISKQELITAPTDSRFQVDVDKNWVESSKVSALMHELGILQSAGSKSIVFSQWTAFLDLLQIPLSRNNIKFLRLDGTLNQQQRERVIKQFSEEDDIKVLLMSLKAGGVGINLTAASNAFVMDPWWNPAVEEQAVMRIHRIGQTKSVSIKRFIVKGTVEERMEAVQARKQRMISGALTDQEVRTARIEELKMLFT
ncbi:putative swi/snf-related matrix-associated actin-dependent regulator of chromatin subfamily a member 3-like 2 [Phtheirospermum japonicum]|uniref:Putative swi/snf-related matrix-associated actin-dependent regulator of chromatin subfamily a member 3-like 2 n=1 Tax=Phtheirospermum japonicum TaxID=374723 RepID=A0A830CIG1_9LAMI|nr:putative swi/snf-related matrix-associated actin-dependent regulator of chromatin subfamily a member 3-like 2 [Phtheirospermum japonicum]